MDRLAEELYSTSRPNRFRSEEDMIEWDANHAPEPDEIFVSECCGAPLRAETLPVTVDPETGYRDGGDTVVCAACGGEAEVADRAGVIPGDRTAPEPQPISPLAVRQVA